MIVGNRRPADEGEGRRRVRAGVTVAGGVFLEIPAVWRAGDRDTSVGESVVTALEKNINGNIDSSAGPNMMASVAQFLGNSDLSLDELGRKMGYSGDLACKCLQAYGG